MEDKLNVKNDAGAQSLLTAGLERLIDGDVTCWGIDDVVAYGIKVAEMEHEACAKIAESLTITINGQVMTGGSFGAWVADVMRGRSNVKLTGCALLRSPG